ncbi:hypothetical protein BCR43DRAFT_483045 [Syncephalastrum racemosum]|uniref:Uncharacterized protein n=1 Tax=Syncephalastrum racemosum TaxID=13706 RepID=A0A1X2HUJ4_SYNRA|nr:hypothetical protein BCR43DRAFT_483045 [Syncephalastrum racemosum]
MSIHLMHLRFDTRRAVVAPCYRRFVFFGYARRLSTTTVEPSPVAARKRPTPVLLLHVQEEKAKFPWNASLWQKRFAQLGYQSTLALYEQRPGALLTDATLNQWYDDLTAAVGEQHFFPPMLLAHDGPAWRLAQKYVSNKPVSAFVLTGADRPDLQVKSYEFEPQFNILLATRTPPAFLEDVVDQVVPHEDEEKRIDQVCEWMDEVGI